MKKFLHYAGLLMVLFLITGLFSCERLSELYRLSDTTGARGVQENNETGGENSENPCGEPVIIPLVHSSDLEYNIGQISITNDDNCLNLKFEMTVAGWEFDQIYLFAGAIDTIPLTEDPYPAFWDFLTLDIDPAVSSYTHCVPLGDLDDCIEILAQVHGLNSDEGNAPLWTKGVNPNWTKGPFYTEYCIENCKDPCDDPSKDPCDDPNKDPCDDPNKDPCDDPCKDPCDDPCDGCKMGIYRTQTPGGWGARAAGNNPGTYRDLNFDDAFLPSGLVVGIKDDNKYFKITLTSSDAIEKLLPTGGKPAALTQSFTDPASIKNVLVGHIVALTLSVGFDDYDDDFGEAEGHLKYLIIADGHGFDGMSIADILEEANIVLGGGFSSYSPSQMTEILTKINEYFVDGKRSKKYKLFDCK